MSCSNTVLPTDFHYSTTIAYTKQYTNSALDTRILAALYSLMQETKAED